MLTIAAVLIPLLFVTAWTFTREKTPGDLINKIGFLEIVPPSTLHAPGTFKTVEYLGDSSVLLHPTCELDRDALSGLTMESKTVDSEIREYLSNRFGAKLLSKLNASLSGEQVETVQLTLHNMKILLLTHEALFEIQDRYLNGSCERAIAHNIRNGAEVCQAEAIIQADMVYRVMYKGGIDSTQQERLTKEIAASVAFNATHQGKNEFKGEGLYYGVKLSKKCLVLDPGTTAST